MLGHLVPQGVKDGQDRGEINEFGRAKCVGNAFDFVFVRHESQEPRIRQRGDEKKAVE